MADASETYTAAELAQLLELWRRPGGVLARDQLQALLEWRDTPAEDRGGLQADLATTVQHADPTPLAPSQRRGHVSWLDRLRALLGRPVG